MGLSQRVQKCQTCTQGLGGDSQWKHLSTVRKDETVGTYPQENLFPTNSSIHLHTRLSTQPMVSDIQDPEFDMAVRIVPTHATWVVSNDRSSVAIDKVLTPVTPGVGAFINTVLAKLGDLRAEAKKAGVINASAAGEHSYLQSVLNNLKNELIEDAIMRKTHKRKLVMQGPLAHPRSILCCAIRMAGGWHNDGMDQEKFLMTCYESNCDVYSEAQLGVSSPCNEWASGGEADAHFCRRCTSSLAVISQ